MDHRPDGARVSIDMIGSTNGDRTIAWSEGDVMLYAIGVGAGLGDPSRDLQFTTENSEGTTLRVLPSFLSLLTTNSKPPALAALDVARFLHAEQEVELLRPLPAAGTGTLCSTIEAVWDKGEHAIVTNASTLRLGDADGPVIGRTRMHVFVRGAGGFGGPRGSATRWTTPDRAPDATIVHRTRPEQALLYRLSGDRHRLHSDPAFAGAHGYDRPILHGLCSYGFACRALVEATGGDPDRLAAMRGRFRAPTYPGDTLTTEIWHGDSRMLFRTINGAGQPVIERGEASLHG